MNAAGLKTCSWANIKSWLSYAAQAWFTQLRYLNLNRFPWLIKSLCESKIMQAAFLTKLFKLIQNIQKKEKKLNLFQRLENIYMILF